MNTDDDPLSQRLRRLAEDTRTAEEIAKDSAQFAAALRRLATDPQEAARVEAIAREVALPRTTGPGTDQDDEFPGVANHDASGNTAMTDTNSTDADPSSETATVGDSAAASDYRPGPRPGEYQMFLPGTDDSGRWVTMTDRDWAGAVLRRVADDTLPGAWPREVTVFDVARALRRAVGNVEYLQHALASNLPEGASLRKAVQDAALEEFLRGWHAANSEHGPISHDDHGTRAEITPEYRDLHPIGAPPGARMRSRKTGRMWWVTEHGEWTDGLTLCSSWEAVCRREHLLFPDA